MLAVLVIALAGIGGFLGYRGLGWPLGSSNSNAAQDKASQAIAEPVRATATAQTATIRANPAAPVIPDRVPAVRLAGLDGKPHALADFHDPVLIINFWATWCVPCRREIPLLRQLRRERHAGGLEIVGVAIDFADAVRSYVKEIGLDYPLMIGEEDGLAAAESFGMDLVLPFTVFADAQRRIVAVKIGELHADEAKLIVSAVQKINANAVDIVSAKADIAAKMRELATARGIAAAAPKS